ncbi:MAG: hypothetical protein ACYTXY_49955, partial [Nostoc sp.]
LALRATSSTLQKIDCITITPNDCFFNHCSIYMGIVLSALPNLFADSVPNMSNYKELTPTHKK